MKNQMKKTKLSDNEIIILSIVIGMFTALILGVVFQREYTIVDGIKAYGKKSSWGDAPKEFNYLLAFGSFIIVSGISYLFLMKKDKEKEREKNEDKDVPEKQSNSDIELIKQLIDEETT